jgi:hypothetical protein
VTWDDGWEPGDPCVEYGEETSAEHWRYSDECYAEQQGWRPRKGDADPAPEPWRAERPPPGTVAAISLSAVVEIRRELAELRRRIEQLETSDDSAARSPLPAVATRPTNAKGGPQGPAPLETRGS